MVESGVCIGGGKDQHEMVGRASCGQDAGCRTVLFSGQPFEATRGQSGWRKRDLLQLELRGAGKGQENIQGA